MSGRFVRASKYRHVFGRSTKKEQCYDNLRISKNAWDTNLVKVNPKYISVNWEASGGGAFAVIPLNERGRLPEQLPLFRGHTAAVLDTDWSPFDDSLVASGSDDGKVMLWKVPEGFTLHHDSEEPQDVKPASKLQGHPRKVGHVLFNPSAQNVLASSSGDYTIKLWDVTSGSSKLTLKHADIVQSLSWNAAGSLMVTTSRDKRLRVWDVRQEKPAVETPGHSGAKNSRAVWMGELDRVATTGFSKMSDRQLGLWDVRAPREPLELEILDQISGVCMPFWDDGTHCLYLAGKGDGNIRYYEYTNDKFEYLSAYTSADPQRGLAFIPKRGVNTHENEVMRAFKTVNDTLIEPISFIVPRRAEAFQSDIYPPAVGLKPAMSAAEWFDGKEGQPPKFDLESLFDGDEPKEVPSDFVAAAPLPAPTKTEPTPTEPPKPVEAPVARAPPPTVNENKASISQMAAKFADKDEESSEDETSSFDEGTKPVERSIPAAAHMDVRSNGSPNLSPAPLPTESPVTSVPPPAESPPTSTPSTPPPNGNNSASTPRSGAAFAFGAGLRGQFEDIKAMLESQTRTILAQSEKLDLLFKEVEKLKAGAGAGDAAKDERIRMLELELEEARS